MAEAHHLGVLLTEVRLAHRGQLDALGLEPGDQPGAPVAGLAAGDDLGGHHGLLPGGGDQAVHGAVVLGALADGEDRRVVGTHLVVHDDAAPHLQPGVGGLLGHGTNAAGEHDQVCLDQLSVVEPDAALLHPGSADAGTDPHAEPGQRLLQHHAGLAVELAFHEVVGQVQERDGQAAPGQAAGGLDAEQAAADDHGPAGVLGRLHDPLAVLQRAERDRPLHAGDRRHDGVAAGGQDQQVVRLAPPVLGHDVPGLPVDVSDRAAEGGRHVVGVVPGGVDQPDLLRP